MHGVGARCTRPHPVDVREGTGARSAPLHVGAAFAKEGNDDCALSQLRPGRNGQEKGRIVGAVGKPQIEQAIRQYL